VRLTRRRDTGLSRLKRAHQTPPTPPHPEPLAPPKPPGPEILPPDVDDPPLTGQNPVPVREPPVKPTPVMHLPF